MDNHYEKINLFAVCVDKRTGFGITMVDGLTLYLALN